MKLVFGFCLFSLTSWAQTVKILSKTHDLWPSERTHSGWGFVQAGRGYVLTVSSSTFGTSLKISAADLPSETPQVVVSDWGRGLALLRTSSLPPWENFNSVPSALLAKGDHLKILGYGVGAAQPSATQPLEVLVEASGRHTFPLVGTMVEAFGAAVWAGNPGAPALDGQGRLVGILSQQYLWLLPGYATEPYEWSHNATQVQSHVLIYPARYVLDWVYAALAGTLSAPFQNYDEEEKTDDQFISVAGLTFHELAPHFSGGGGLGGDFPVGGGDGVGVGGDAQLSLASKLVITAAPTVKTAFPFPSPWLADLKALAASPVPAEIPFLLRFNPVTQREEYKSFRSVSEFFRLLARGQGTPLFLPTRAPAGHGDLYQAAAKVAEFVSDHRRWLAYHGEEVSFLLKTMYLYAKRMQADPKANIALKDLDELGNPKGPYQKGWAMMTTYPSVGGPLEGLFKTLRDEFAKGR